MARRRAKGTTTLPPYLYEYTVKGIVYYRYRHPETGKYHSMGKDRSKAMQAARILNERLLGSQDLVARVLGGNKVADLKADFDREILLARDYAEKTRKEYLRHLTDFATATAGKIIGNVTTRDCALHLDSFPARSSNQRRNTLILFFRYCRAKGLIDHNPAEATLPKQHSVQRMRMTWAQYQAIYRYATQPIRNAMDVSLETLQARLEISRMRIPRKKDEYLDVIRQKTAQASVERAKRGKEAAAFLRIRINDKLRAIIERCRDDVASAYLVHYGKDARIRSYVGQPLTPEAISRGLQDARDLAIRHEPEVFQLPDGTLPAPAQLPTFHEIRSLGAELKRQAGWPEERIQKLMAHTDVKMTKEYLEGHRDQWVVVET